MPVTDSVKSQCLTPSFFPGVFSQGETLDALENNIKEAYRLMMMDEEQTVSVTRVQRKELFTQIPKTERKLPSHVTEKLRTPSAI